MENIDLYLLSFTFSGIKNIEKPVRLDFYKKTVDKNFDSSLYRVKSIYGENGSGKTAVITAASIFRNLIIDNMYLSDSKNQRLLRELINKKMEKIHMEAEIRNGFKKDEIVVLRYILELEDVDGVISITKEGLDFKNANYNSSQYSVAYNIEQGEIKTFRFEKEVEEQCRLKTMNLLSMKSMVSLFNPILRSIAGFTSESTGYYIVSIVAFGFKLRTQMDESDMHQIFLLKKMIGDNQDTSILKELYGDMYVSTMRNIGVKQTVPITKYKQYESQIERLTVFLKLFKRDLKDIIIEKKEDGEMYHCELVMDYEDYKINGEFESTGICKLINLFDCFDFATNGGILFVDELDSNINDIYLCKLIQYFMYYGQGQLVFTVHNPDPMNVLKDNKNSISFLANNKIVDWKSSGNSSPENSYKNGMIEGMTFNIEPSDFLGILGVTE